MRYLMRKFHFFLFLIFIFVLINVLLNQLNNDAIALSISGSNINTQNIPVNTNTSLSVVINPNQNITSTDNIKLTLGGLINNVVFDSSNVQILGCSGTPLIISSPINTMQPNLIVSGINCPINGSITTNLSNNSLNSVSIPGVYLIQVFINGALYDTYTISVGGDNSVVISGQINYRLRFRVYPEKRTPSFGNFSNVYLLQIINPITNTIVYQKSGIVADNNGEFEEFIPSQYLPHGIYKVRIKGISHLSKDFNNVQIKNNTNFYNFTSGGNFLLAGDTSVIEDDLINSLDISRLEKTLFTNILRSDLNKDGYVNSLDMSIQAYNINKYNIYGESL